MLTPIAMNAQNKIPIKKMEASCLFSAPKNKTKKTLLKMRRLAENLHHTE